MPPDWSWLCKLLPAVRVYGKRGSPQAYAIRDFLQRSDVPFEWVELGSNEQAPDELGLENLDDFAFADLHLSGRYTHGAPHGAPDYREARLVPQSIPRRIRCRHLRRRTGWAECLGLCRLGGVACLGGVPNTQWAKAVSTVRDEEGYLVTGPDLRKFTRPAETWKLNREPYYLETSMPGVRCRWREARFDQARRVSGRRGRNGDSLRASLSRRGIGRAVHVVAPPPFAHLFFTGLL